MKVVFIIPDGLQDDNIVSGQSPVEHAYAPCLHEIASKSQPVLLKTVYQGLPIGSIVANLGLLGYDPYKFFPGGRSYFELRAGYDGTIEENDLILRCNTISINEDDSIADFTAGQISNQLAIRVTNEISLRLPSRINLFHGKNYRNTLILKNTCLNPKNIITFEPHSRIGKNVFDLRIIQSNCNLTIDQKLEIQYLNSVMYSTIVHFREINRTMCSKVDMLWFWEPSYPISLGNFSHKFIFKSPWLITGSDFLYGIAKEANIAFQRNELYTGEIDTSYEQKGIEAVAKLKEGVDFLFVHINATDEESHQKRFHGKVKVIEKVDHYIIKPVFECLKNLSEDFILTIGGDHYTSSKSGNHLDLNAPFIVFNSKREKNVISKFSEREIISKNPLSFEAKDLIPKIMNV